jgi:hypothetical protein
LKFEIELPSGIWAFDIHLKFAICHLPFDIDFYSLFAPVWATI